MTRRAAKPERPVGHWLMKSEPDAFSIDDLKRKKREAWDGVRNYQARNFMRDGMRPGDRVFFYHSNCAEPGIVGIAEVASEAYPDPSQFDPHSKYFDPASTHDKPRWMLVEVKFVRKLKRTITLKELQAQPALREMPLVRKGNRLSVMPVSAEDWAFVLALE
jgi:predicted RNA-binding protein with PUA-like domain